MPGRVELEVGLRHRGRPRDDGEPMRLLLFGDFSGTAPGERPPLASRPIFPVDIDNVDEVMRRLRPRATLFSGEIEFRRLDDFHPDQIFARVDLFKALRVARDNPPAASADLGRLLGKPVERGPVRAPAAANPLDALIRDIVAPHIVKDTSRESGAHVAGIDAAIAEQMRALLHHPAFQSLESAWRGVQWLISSLELDERLQLHLLDVSRAELDGDIAAEERDLAQTGMYRALVDRLRNGADRHRWSALVGLIQIGPADADLRLLGALGLIASQAGGVLLGGADEALASSQAAALAGWQALRRSINARRIALAAPRVLLRLPYGSNSDPIESFAFEEIVGPPVHEHFLWGNASLALALLIGRAFTEKGWAMEPGDEREIGNLPAYTFVRDGEREMQPCAERLLTDREVQSMLDAGLLPIASRRNSNAAVAVRFQSIADPIAPLVWE